MFIDLRINHVSSLCLAAGVFLLMAGQSKADDGGADSPLACLSGERFAKQQKIQSVELPRLATEADILAFDFTSAGGDDINVPTLEISIKLSSSFSNAQSVQVPYWPEGNDQTWVGVPRIATVTGTM